MTQEGMENQNMRHRQKAWKSNPGEYKTPQDKTRHKNTTQRTRIKSHDNMKKEMNDMEVPSM